MSWIVRNAKLSECDRSLLTYRVSESLVFSQIKRLQSALNQRNQYEESNSSDSSSRFLSTPTEWYNYLENGSCVGDQKGESRIDLILAGKGLELSNLPFTESAFTKIAEQWWLHSSIVRALIRTKSCHFGHIPYEWSGGSWQGQSFVYNCRTPDTWKDDMALSVTYFPETLTTKAVWYGCGLSKKEVHGWSMSDAEIITGRLKNFDGEVLHPMMLPTLFAEFERERLIGLSRANGDELVRRLRSLSPPDIALAQASSEETESAVPSPKSPNVLMIRARTWFSRRSNPSQSTEKVDVDHLQTTSFSSKDNEDIKKVPTVLVWLRLSHLRNGLESWRVQLIKMIDHVEELETMNYGLGDENTDCTKGRLSALRSTGKRITGRLQELLFECDEATRDCTRAMEGMNLANQLETNIIGRRDTIMNQRTSENSLHLAHAAQRDAEIMKPIAVLGMVFLPGMFTSSFFSIGFFEYRDDKHLSASQYIWIWAGVTFFATALTLVLFQIATAKRLQKVIGSNNVNPV